MEGTEKSALFVRGISEQGEGFVGVGRDDNLIEAFCLPVRRPHDDAACVPSHPHHFGAAADISDQPSRQFLDVLLAPADDRMPCWTRVKFQKAMVFIEANE